MWGPTSGLKLMQKISHSVTTVAAIDTNQVAILSNGLTPGATISSEDSTAVLVAPTF